MGEQPGADDAEDDGDEDGFGLRGAWAAGEGGDEEDDCQRGEDAFLAVMSDQTRVEPAALKPMSTNDDAPEPLLERSVTCP
jgi:hypothetical protein